jgi:phosphoribosylformylglycinamidine cyclo-ligase
MEEPSNSKYAKAGVDLKAAGEVVKRIGELALSTFNERVLTGIGTFGALYHLGQTEEIDPVIVSSVDGVGTKLKIAFLADRHDTVGMDLVNHCVNDILTMGARPLFFMDYLAVGKMEVGVVEQVISGLKEGCRLNHVPLIGGETAEMPGFYRPGEYDLAGFIVGCVDRGGLFDGSRIALGDQIIGLPSNGLHTNGYSLVRKVLLDDGESVLDPLPGWEVPLHEELLRVHKSYLKSVGPLLGREGLHGMAHITGVGRWSMRGSTPAPGRFPQFSPASRKGAESRETRCFVSSTWGSVFSWLSLPWLQVRRSSSWSGPARRRNSWERLSRETARWIWSPDLW